MTTLAYALESASCEIRELFEICHDLRHYFAVLDEGQLRSIDFARRVTVDLGRLADGANCYIGGYDAMSLFAQAHTRIAAQFGDSLVASSAETFFAASQHALADDMVTHFQHILFEVGNLRSAYYATPREDAPPFQEVMLEPSVHPDVVTIVQDATEQLKKPAMAEKFTDFSSDQFRALLNVELAEVMQILHERGIADKEVKEFADRWFDEAVAGTITPSSPSRFQPPPCPKCGKKSRVLRTAPRSS